MFTGRQRALSDLVAWLVGNSPPAMRVVTGPPGGGKSAVLARLVTASDRRYRERMPEFAVSDPTVPPVGAIDVTFHAKDRTVQDFIGHVGDVCQFDAGDVPGLLTAVGRRGGRLVMVVDALDEATEFKELGSLLVELSGRGCRVLVGCRPHLAATLGDPNPLKLDESPYLEKADVELYVRRRLAFAASAQAQMRSTSPTRQRGTSSSRNSSPMALRKGVR